MKYYVIHPQVAGELGPNTKYASREPLRVSHVEFLFNIWPCDALIESYPCFIVRSDLLAAIKANNLTGCLFEECNTGFTDYVESSSSIFIPKFYRLNPIGIPGKDDFALGATQKLIVSHIARGLLENWLFDCEYKNFTGA